MLEHINRIGLRDAAVGKGQPPELADDQIDARARFACEEGTRIRTDQMRTGIKTPHAKAPAAASEIEHDIDRLHVEKLPQHRVAHGGRQQWRGDRFVAAVGVKALLEKLRRLAECTARAQVEEVRVTLGKRPAARRTLQRRRLPLEWSAAIGAPDELEKPRRNHGDGWGW